MFKVSSAIFGRIGEWFERAMLKGYVFTAIVGTVRMRAYSLPNYLTRYSSAA